MHDALCTAAAVHPAPVLNNQVFNKYERVVPVEMVACTAPGSMVGGVVNNGSA